jgi:hypothetical protein
MEHRHAWRVSNFLENGVVGNFDLNPGLPVDPPRFGPQSVGTQMLLSYDQLTG